MKFSKSDLKIETMKGTGPGGQRKNKVETAVRITHLPTGISAYADETTQKSSKRKAMKDLENKILEAKEAKKAAVKKEKRDAAIKDRTIVRTYDFKSNIAKDHRTGRRVPLKEVLEKGNLDLFLKKGKTK